MRLKPLHGVALAIGIAFGSAGYAQTSADTAKSNTAAPAKSDKSASNLPHADRNFVEKVAQHNLAEIELGKLAEKNASSEEVKRFGRQMVDDHTKANEELKQIADSKGINFPAEADRGHRRTLDKLAKENGDKFDKDFIKDMVKDHKADSKDFHKEADNKKADADVKSFADKNESVIDKHLQMAQQLQNSTKVSSRSERSSSMGSSGRSRSSNSSSGSSSSGSPSRSQNR